MLFQSRGGTGVRAQSDPQRAQRLDDDFNRRRRNALWLHATTSGLFDPVQNRVRCYSTTELAALWGVTRRAVRYGIHEALEDQERLKSDDAG